MELHATLNLPTQLKSDIYDIQTKQVPLPLLYNAMRIYKYLM